MPHPAETELWGTHYSFSWRSMSAALYTNVLEIVYLFTAANIQLHSDDGSVRALRSKTRTRNLVGDDLIPM